MLRRANTANRSVLFPTERVDLSSVRFASGLDLLSERAGFDSGHMASAAVLGREVGVWRASQLPELLTRKQTIVAAAASGLTFTEQLRTYLSSHYARVIDLLREWVCATIALTVTPQLV